MSTPREPNIAHRASIAKPPNKRWRAGLSLIELLVFIVLVSVGVLAVLQVFSLTVKNSPDPQLRKQALALAEGLLEEVQLAHFTWCDPLLDAQADDPVARPSPAACSTVENVGPESADHARPFDNINDYVNQLGVDTAAFNRGGQLQDAAGEEIKLPGYSASLRISAENLQGITSSASAAGMEVLRISVTVFYNERRESVTLDTWRTRYAPHATP